jgi:hypothetical protein
VKFDDSGVEVELDVAPVMDKAQFALVGQPMFAVREMPGLYVLELIKFSIQISTEDGTTYGLLIGFGVAYEIDAGPFKLKGLFALTMFGFMGDTTLGFGIGFVLKLGLAIEPIVSVEIYLEGQLAVASACRGTGNDTTYGAAKLTFGVKISVCLVFSISFEVETTASEVINGRRALPASRRPAVSVLVEGAANDHATLAASVSPGMGRDQAQSRSPRRPAIQPARFARLRRAGLCRCGFQVRGAPRGRARGHPDHRDRVHRDRRGRTSSAAGEGDLPGAAGEPADRPDDHADRPAHVLGPFHEIRPSPYRVASLCGRKQSIRDHDGSLLLRLESPGTGRHGPRLRPAVGGRAKRRFSRVF